MRMQTNHRKSPDKGPHVLDNVPSSLTDWMSAVDDQVLLSAISIPGTHDSAAYTLNVPFIATQRMDITTQLNSGIRYFDFRCGIRKDVIEMVHGPTILGITFEDLLAAVYSWLAVHPTEALVVQLKKYRRDEDSTVLFSRAVMELIAKHSESWSTVNETPTLGQARGKIQLLRRFRGADVTAYGINVSRWQDNPTRPFTMRCGHGIKVTVQDHYRYVDPVTLPELVSQKSEEITDLLRRAHRNKTDAHWYINFTSALEFNWSHRYPPRDVAEGSWYAFRRVQGVNDTLKDFLTQNADQTAGIIAMDFPDSKLIAMIIKKNFRSSTAVVKGLFVFALAAVISFAMLVMWSFMRYMRRNVVHFTND